MLNSADQVLRKSHKPCNKNVPAVLAPMKFEVCQQAFRNTTPSMFSNYHAGSAEGASECEARNAMSGRRPLGAQSGLESKPKGPASSVKPPGPVNVAALCHKYPHICPTWLRPWLQYFSLSASLSPACRVRPGKGCEAGRVAGTRACDSASLRAIAGPPASCAHVHVRRSLCQQHAL